MSELDRYIPKHMQRYSGTFVPNSPLIKLQIDVLHKDNQILIAQVKQLKDKLAELKEHETIINYLQEFKKQFYIYCLNEKADISILHCARNNDCVFRHSCTGRKDLGRKLKYI